MKDPRRARRLRALLIAGAVCALAWPAAAQLGGLGRGLGGAVGGVLSPLTPVLQAPQTLDRTLDPILDPLALNPSALLGQREDRLNALVRAHPREIERDDAGAPVARGRVLAIAPTTEALARARQAGFVVIPTPDAGDGIGLVVLAPPPGVSARAAVKTLRRLDPGGAYDYDHLYEPSGQTAAMLAESAAATGASWVPNARLGLIDTGVDATAPVFAQARIEQNAFAGAAVRPAPHGTAVASLLIGHAGAFSGAAPGAGLLAADVYGGAPAGGAAEALVRALFWLEKRHATVVNISLVGPPNLALAAAIRAVQARGVVLVAAVGNDGPAAPPAYPASYPGVVAVTGVDAHGHVLLEAGHAAHLDFAAPGADMAAAAPGGGFVAVRGTSFAAPLVAGRLAALMAGDGLSAADAENRLAASGQPGHAYGRALVAMTLRTAPTLVRASDGD